MIILISYHLTLAMRKKCAKNEFLRKTHTYLSLKALLMLKHLQLGWFSVQLLTNFGDLYLVRSFRGDVFTVQLHGNFGGLAINLLLIWCSSNLAQLARTHYTILPFPPRG